MFDYTLYDNEFSYGDDTAEESACGTSITILNTTMQMASTLLSYVVDIVMERRIIPMGFYFNNAMETYIIDWPNDAEDEEAIEVSSEIDLF